MLEWRGGGLPLSTGMGCADVFTCPCGRPKIHDDRTSVAYSTTSFLATNRGQLSLQSQLYLLKTTCQRPIKNTCCKTINKHLRIEPTMTLCLITSGTDPETSFCIKLTASNIIDNDQEKGIFEILKSSGAKYRVSFGNNNPDSICPHAHVKTGQIGTYCVNTFSPSSNTGQHGSGVTYHRAIFPTLIPTNGSAIILSVGIGLLSHPKIHHLNSSLV